MWAPAFFTLGNRTRALRGFPVFPRVAPGPGRARRPAPLRAAPSRPGSRPPRGGGRPGDNTESVQPCAMAVSPEGIPAPPVDTPPPPPEAHTLEPGSDSGAGRLSFCTKVCYGIGGVPNQVASSAIAFYLQLFLLDVAQIPAAQVSLVLFGGKVSGAAADPLAGFFINRSRRTGSGRLMPWVLGCTPFIALASFFLWFLPPFTSLRGLWYTALYCLFQALATFFQVPYTALTMLLTPSPRERDSATVYRMTLEMAGTLMGATVHGLIVSGAHGSHRCKETALPGQVAISPNATRLYSIAATVVAVTYPVCSSLLCLGVKERPDASARASGQGLSFLAGLRLTVRHPPYLKLVISFLFISAAVQVEQCYLVLFCAHASRLHDHVQSLVITILGMVPFAILLAAVPTAPVAYVVAFVSGVSIAVSLLLPWSMLPDVVDEFQLQHQHGPGLETIFYSSYVFFTKLSGGPATASLELETRVSWSGRSSVFWTPKSPFLLSPSAPLLHSLHTTCLFPWDMASSVTLLKGVAWAPGPPPVMSCLLTAGHLR
ncbi:sphingosine-1-phosphate transporter MFSD2B isoform X3 [Mesoplodon densirostris]|uniref:sphingosine-1-phosphate transporter MFSD2B isoform X3 n=1 Tax=Mesoplodon densirostris TaxID=48708 RepID=UPI0028DCD804|nr:sphingosine-1-phosphate transporter MFSD2B isoform X3 [Mesoplodon densirostris]